MLCRCKAEALYVASATTTTTTTSTTTTTTGSSSSTLSSSSSGGLREQLQAVYSRCHELSPRLHHAVDSKRTCSVIYCTQLHCTPLFLCCYRCKAEARYASTATSSSSSSDSLREQLQTVYSRCQELSPQLDEAVESEDLPAIRAVQRELLQLQEGVEGGIRAAKPPANVRRWLQVGGGGVDRAVQ